MRLRLVAIVLGALLPCSSSLAEDVKVHTYKSPDGSFTFQYAEPLLLCQHDGENWTPNEYCKSQRPLCGDSNMVDQAIACVAEPRPKGPVTLAEATFAVSVIAQANNAENCFNDLQKSELSSNPKTVELHGSVFHVTYFSDAATSQSWNIRAYRTFHDGKCYELTRTIADVSTGPYDPGQIVITSQQERTAIEERLQETLESFRFTK